MSKQQRVELRNTVVGKLEEAAQLLIKAKKAVFAAQVGELAELMSSLGNITSPSLAPVTSRGDPDLAGSR